MSKIASSGSSDQWVRGLYQQGTTSRKSEATPQTAAFGATSVLPSGDDTDSTMSIAEEDPSKTPPETEYATVMVNGQVQAHVYNDGTVTMPWQGSDTWPMLLPLEAADGKPVGPSLAKTRAEAVAEALGGTVTMSSTAQTQAEWEAAHPDWEDHKNYQYSTTPFEDTNAISAQTLHSVQEIGQGDDDTKESDAVSAFREYMDLAHKGPGALMRAQYLASKGLTEDDVASMSKADRDKLEKEIEDFIKKKFEEDTGVAVGETGVSSVA